MITLFEIQNAITKTLRTQIGLEVYSNEALENLRLPCFFILTRERETTPCCNGIFRRVVEIIINYRPKEGNGRTMDEPDGLKMQSRLASILTPALQIGDDWLTTQQTHADFAGENTDIPVFSLETEFFDDMEPENGSEQPTPPILIEAVDVDTETH